MRSQTWLTLLLSAIGGAGIWALSPWLAGVREPWDAGGLYYPVALLMVGVIAGALSPRPLWAHYLGGLIGQLGYLLLLLGAGSLWVVGLIFMAVYTLILLLGAALAAWAGKGVGR